MAVKKKVVEIDTKEAQTSVKSLRELLKELKDTMLSTEKGTEEYNEALRKSADIMHTLKEQQEELNASAMDFGQIAGNCTKAVGGLVGGLLAAKATMNLFGVENEDVIKSLQKMQSLMAITQALPAIDNGIKAFKRLALVIKSATGAMNGFKAALVESGIGLAVVALGALVANWDKLTGAVNKEAEAEKKRNQEKLTSELKNYNDELQRTLTLRLKIAGIQGDSDLEIAQLTLRTYAEAYKILNDLKETGGGSLLGDEWTKANNPNLYNVALQNAKDASDKLTELFGTPIKVTGLNLEGLITQYGKLLIAQNKSVEELKQLDKATRDAAAGKKAEEELKKLEEYYKKIAIELWNSTQQLAPQSLQEELEAKFRENPLTIPVKLEIDEEEELSADDLTFLAKATELKNNVESVVDSLRKAFITPEEQYKQEIDALELALNTKLISQQEYNTLSEALQKEHSDKMKVLAVQEAQVWMSALSNLGSVFASMADMVDLSTEEGQEKYKALMYTSTIVSMLAGIGGAIASAFMPVNAGMTIFGQIAMAASTSASVLASGIAQLMQIKNANENSTLSGAGSLSKPSTSALTSIQAPVQYTQDVQGANIEGAIKDSRVYVVESDITNTQNRVKVTENEARF